MYYSRALLSFYQRLSNIHSGLSILRFFSAFSAFILFRCLLLETVASAQLYHPNFLVATSTSSSELLSPSTRRKLPGDRKGEQDA